MCVCVYTCTHACMNPYDHTEYTLYFWSRLTRNFPVSSEASHFFPLFALPHVFSLLPRILFTCSLCNSSTENLHFPFISLLSSPGSDSEPHTLPPALGCQQQHRGFGIDSSILLSPLNPETYLTVSRNEAFSLILSLLISWLCQEQREMSLGPFPGLYTCPCVASELLPLSLGFDFG